MLSRKLNIENGIRIEALLLAVYFALVPLENVLVSNLGGSVNKYIGILIIVIIVLKHLLSLKINISNYKTILAFFGYALLTTIWSIGSENDYVRILINMVLCTLIFIQVPLRKSEINLIYFSIVLAGDILSAILMSGGSSTVVNNISGGRMTLVLGGLEIDNNNLAVSISLCAIIAFSIFYSSKHKVYRAFGIASFLIITVAVFFTGSRGGLLAEIIGLVIYLWKAGNGLKLRSIIAAAIAIIAFAYILQNFLSASLAERFTLKSVIDSGGTGRTTIWEHALITFDQSSLLRQFFGYGFGTFGRVQELHWGRLVASHNDFIGMLIELGIIGEIIFITVWINLIRKTVRDENWIGLALLVTALIGSLSLEMVVKKMLWMAWYLALVPQTEGIASGERTFEREG